MNEPRCSFLLYLQVVYFLIVSIVCFLAFQMLYFLAVCKIAECYLLWSRKFIVHVTYTEQGWEQCMSLALNKEMHSACHLDWRRTETVHVTCPSQGNV